MIKLRFEAKDCRCCGCGAEFEDGDILVLDPRTEKTYCTVCSFPDEEGFPEDRYDVTGLCYLYGGGSAVYLAENYTIWHLPEGYYELIKTTFGKWYVARELIGDIRFDDFDEERAVLVRGDNADAVLLQRPDGYPYDFVETDEEAVDYIRALNGIIGYENDYFIVSEDNVLNEPRVMGMLAHFDCEEPPEIDIPLREYDLFSRVNFLGKFKQYLANKRKMGGVLEKLTPKAMYDYVRSRIRGQDEALKSALYMVYRYLVNFAEGRDVPAENWMITAPSGAGKTEFYRSVKALFKEYGIDIPVVQIDLSQISEAGFKGNNPDTIIARLAAENPERGGYAICFLDEADKKFCPSFTSGGNNVNAAVQGNLLTLIEGIEMKVDVGDEVVNFDTGKTMFVFMGAFQPIRDKKHQKKLTRGVGFGSELEKKDSTEEAHDVFYEEVDMQDMIDYGMLEEIAGRLVRVVNFGRISEADMAELIRDKVVKIGEEYGCSIRITDKAVEEIVGISYGTVGIRKPINRIKQLVQDTLADALFGDGFNELTDHILIESADKARIVSQAKDKKKNKPANEG